MDELIKKQDELAATDALLTEKIAQLQQENIACERQLLECAQMTNLAALLPELDALEQQLDDEVVALGQNADKIIAQLEGIDIWANWAADVAHKLAARDKALETELAKLTGVLAECLQQLQGYSALAVEPERLLKQLTVQERELAGETEKLRNQTQGLDGAIAVVDQLYKSFSGLSQAVKGEIPQ